jgi:hypothetical protein
MLQQYEEGPVAGAFLGGSWCLFGRYDLSFTTTLSAVHAGSVALTQPAGATVAGSGF